MELFLVVMSKLTQSEILELKEIVKERREEAEMRRPLEEAQARTIKRITCKKCGKIKVSNWVTAMLAGGANSKGIYKGRCYCKKTK